MEKHLYGMSKSTFKLPGLSNNVQMEMERGLYFANISVTYFIVSPESTISSTTTTSRPKISTFSPIISQTEPVEDVPTYEANLTNEICAESSISLIKSAAKIKDPFNMAKKTGSEPKKANNGECWNDWPEEYRTWPENRQKLPAEVETEAQYQMFLQYIFYTQWMKVKKAANDAGIQIMGDVPFYVGQDSVDVWGGKDNFLLDTDGRPIFIAGVPPDYFSATGQRWGNPIYDWEHMKEQDYRFWVDRIGYSNKLFDIIRIDHFRAFDTYWKIPADCPTAIDGEWIEAPGYEVIDTLQKEIPGLDLVAEDLGLLRPEVLMLKDHYHLKGMKILIFSIETGGKYARDTFHDVENMIFYTGTHDNDTIMQWYGNMSAAARRKIRRMLKKAGASQGSVKDRFLQYTMQNQAEYAIIPLADILGLGKEGHINTPGTIGSPNWERHLPDFIQAKKELQKFGRLIVDTKR